MDWSVGERIEDDLKVWDLKEGKVELAFTEMGKICYVGRKEFGAKPVV